MTQPIDILAEHALCKSLRQIDIDGLVTEGIPTSSLLRSAFGKWSLILRDKVILGSRGFEFDRYRRRYGSVGAYILIGLDEFGEPADLVAFRPPDTLATWLGHVALLGEEQVYAPRLEPLQIYENAIDWLRAGRVGCVVIDPVQAAPLLRQAGPLVAANVRHGERLKKMLSVSPPRVLVAVAEIAA